MENETNDGDGESHSLVSPRTPSRMEVMESSIELSRARSDEPKRDRSSMQFRGNLSMASITRERSVLGVNFDRYGVSSSSIERSHASVSKERSGVSVRDLGSVGGLSLSDVQDHARDSRGSAGASVPEGRASLADDLAADSNERRRQSGLASIMEFEKLSEKSSSDHDHVQGNEAEKGKLAGGRDPPRQMNDQTQGKENYGSENGEKSNGMTRLSYSEEQLPERVLELSYPLDLSHDLRFIEYGLDWMSEINCPLPPVSPQKKRGARLHEWSYHMTPRLLRNPFYEDVPVCRRLCCHPGQRLTTTKYSGPDRKKTVGERRWARYNCLEDRTVAKVLATPNPAVSVPMRPRKWKPMTWMERPEDVQKWKIDAEQEKARKDREKAQKLGYETLVGNIVYYQIPGAKDLNRSWKHFLDQDPMAWGFPYAKGSRERPCLPLPSPYLVHQMREQLWKYPRNKLIVHSVTPPGLPATEDGP